jgi:hypothetical protein
MVCPVQINRLGFKIDIKMTITKRILSKLGMLVPKFGERAFLIGLLVLIVFKLWLVQAEEIYGSTTEYDCLWWLDSAKHWYWSRPYSWTAFFRPPAYPLFIALVHSLGIPLRIATEFFQIGGYLALIAVLRRMQLARWVCLSIFAALVLHPASFQLNNDVQPDMFYAALLMYALAGLLLTLITNRMVTAILTGLSFALLWNTREVDFLLPILFATYLALAFWKLYPETGWWRQTGEKFLAPALSIFATTVILTLAVYAMNYRAFKGFSKSQMTAPSFKAAYRALVDIKPSRTIRFIPVSNEAFHLAYGVSPTFAQLENQFEGKLGRDWQAETLSTHGISGEIGAGWLRFALPNVAASVGAYQDPAKTNRFYRAVAREINRACRKKRIPSRFVLSTFLDPGAIRSLRFFPESLGRITAIFFLRYTMSTDREDAILRPAQRALYDEMAGRRSSLTQIGTLRIVGWAFQFGDPLQLVGYDSGGGEIPSATTRFGPRPDIVESYKAQGDVPPNMEFGLPITVRHGKIPAGNLLFVTQSGRKFIGSTTSVLSGEAPRENGAADGNPLVCRIFAQEFTPSSINHSLRTENFIGKYYRTLVLALAWAGLAAAMVLAFYRRRLRWNDPLNAVLVLSLVIIASRIALFAFIDATSWRANDPRYLFPVIPLYSAMLIVFIYQAVRIARAQPENAQ